MPNSKLTQFLLLPNLKLLKFERFKKKLVFHCESMTQSIWCTHCGLEITKVHDRRIVTIKDAPYLRSSKILKIRKKRFRCSGCKKVITETLPGITKRSRVTERMQRNILYTCHKFANMKDARKHLKLGNKTIYKRHYKELELKWNEKKNNPWPRSIGIDEHSFIRNKQYSRREFVTLVTDHNNQRVKEILPTRTIGELKSCLSYIPGRENVKNITMDLSSTYRSFARDFFPNAKVIADKFHVVRLPGRILDRYRNKTFKDKRLKLRKYLLMDSRRLDYWKRKEFQRELEKYPELNEVYWVKEAIYKLYRCRGRKRATRSLEKLTDALALSKIPELKTLRRTLKNWREEILNYFENRLTNVKKF